MPFRHIKPSGINCPRPYNWHMRNNKYDNLPPELERYLAHCKRVYEEMERDGTWPWKDNPDSTLSENLVDLDNNPDNL
jgi:hypothetical protein